MPAYIHHIGTRVPDTTHTQDYARDRLKLWSDDPRTRRLIHAIYNRSGIDKRHIVIDDFVEGREPRLFRSDAQGRPVSPTTGERNRIYAEGSRALAVELARDVLDSALGFSRQDVTHIVFASCTGFANPGPDFHIIRELGLRESIERYTLGFMGCYAAFPALRMAAQFCEANREAVVLVICLELCSLHMRINNDPNCILANSLFADGAGAAIISAREPGENVPGYRIDGFASALLPSGEGDMAWEIGDEGFNIVLSSYVPEIIGSNIESLLAGVLGSRGMSTADVDEWAVHPGGRSILDKVQQSLALPADALRHSRSVLREFGNMSSATILFVLHEMLRCAETERAATCALAFGPGLTVETAMFQRIGGPAKPKRAEVPLMADAGVLHAVLG